MFDIGWSEMAIIMLLALIIIGPKDLPRVARTVGQWVRKGRMLAREFQTSLEDMARETELDDVKKEIEKVGRTDLKKAVENSIDPKGELSKAFDTGDGDDKTVAKTLNGSGEAGAKASEAKKPTAAVETSTAKAKAPAAKAAAAKAGAASKPAAAKAKKPASAASKPATASQPAASAKKASTPKKPAAKKPATPRKRAAKPAASSKPADAVAAKPS